MAESSTGPSQIVRRQLWHTNALADSFTMCQTAFTVIPLPCFPTLLTLRKSLPRSMPPHQATLLIRFHPVRNRNRSNVASLTHQVDDGQCSPAAEDDPSSMRRLRVFSTHTRAGEPTKRGLVSFQPLAIRRLPKRLPLLCSQPVAKANA